MGRDVKAIYAPLKEIVGRGDAVKRLEKAFKIQVLPVENLSAAE
jgi:hypothetical protein